jgi:ribonuclease T
MAEIYISVDIETAGPIPGEYSMLSLGACQIDKTDLNFYVELRPITEKFNTEAMNVVGKTLSDFKECGVEPLEAMSKFNDWLATIKNENEIVFVGFNAAFDWSFVNWYFHYYLGANPFGFGGVDIKSFYMGISGCSWADSRSSRIPDSLKGSSPHTHNALDDAIEQAEMFRQMRFKIDQAN